jgi:hypothetical protein
MFIYYEYTIPCYKYVFLSFALRLNAATADFCAITFINIKTKIKLETAYKEVISHEWDLIFI